MKRLLLVLLASLTFPAITFAEFDPKDFPATTLKVFEAKQPNDGPGNKFSTPIQALAIEVTSPLKFRKLSPTTKAFLQQYEAMLGDSMKRRDILSAYEEELETKESGGRTLWIPVQKVLVPALKKELKGGDPFTVYLRYFGAREKEHIYLMIEFLARNKPDTGISLLTFAKLCEMIHCNEPGGQMLNPPLQFKMDGKFTGKTRESGKALETFLANYQEGFPETFQIPAAQLYRAFLRESEFEDAATKKKFWLPLQRDSIEQIKPNAAVRIHAGVYGTQSGEITTLGVNFESTETTSLLRRARSKK